MLLTSLKVNRKKLKRKKSLTMTGKKSKCLNMTRCDKRRMGLAIKDGNQVLMTMLVVCNLKTMTNQVTIKKSMTMKIAMKKVYNKKKMKMMNKAITTFENEMND